MSTLTFFNTVNVGDIYYIIMRHQLLKPCTNVENGWKVIDMATPYNVQKHRVEFDIIFPNTDTRRIGMKQTN